MMAVIPANPGHFDPLGVDTITLSREAAAIPQFIVVGSAVTGTARPYAYFRRHFDEGAPWTFVVQNDTPHCCVMNAKALMLAWLDAVAVQRVSRNGGWYGFIQTRPSETHECPQPFPPAVPVWCRGAEDSWHGGNWWVSDSAIAQRPNEPPEMMPSGWLPTREFAQQWQAFVTQSTHPILSLR
jgi:hypothetical protein